MNRYSMAIVGTGGTGVMTCGEILLRLWARAGGRGFLRKVFGAQIRGGAAATVITFTEDETYAADSRCDLVFVLDWQHYPSIAEEIRLSRKTILFCDDINRIPGHLLQSQGNVHHVPIRALSTAAGATDSENIVALGVLARIAGLDPDATCEEVKRTFRKADPMELQRHINALQVAREVVIPDYLLGVLAPLQTGSGRGREEAWIATGNQMAALGTRATGIGFVAGYPITPATDILEWLASPRSGYHGEFVQAEDELAAVNMAIGASFGGVPAMTATSGPGLALMTESIGLAVASETPVTIINVMRGGPSTGIPTKSEQSDLNIALYGQHGDAPHLVLAPCSIADCATTTQWSILLAEQLQTVAIVLSDQFLGHSQAIISPPDIEEKVPQRKQPFAASLSREGYRRYALTADGISPMATPGLCNHRYTAEGLEHTEAGVPSALHAVHQEQLAKRLRKLQGFDFGPRWADISLWRDGQAVSVPTEEGCAREPEAIRPSGLPDHRPVAASLSGSAGTAVADVTLIGFGSLNAVLQQTAADLSARGLQVQVICLRLLMPLQTGQLEALLRNTGVCWVIEQNHGAQLYHYLTGQLGRHARTDWRSLARSGPAPLFADDISREIQAHRGNRS